MHCQSVFLKCRIPHVSADLGQSATGRDENSGLTGNESSVPVVRRKKIKQNSSAPVGKKITTATELEAFPLSSSFVESKRNVFTPDALPADMEYSRLKQLKLNTPTCHILKTKFLP